MSFFRQPQHVIPFHLEIGIPLIQPCEKFKPGMRALGVRIPAENLLLVSCKVLVRLRLDRL